VEYAGVPMNKMNKKQWIGLALWFLLYITALEFFRFQFGIHKISLAFGLIGTALLYFLGRPKKDTSHFNRNH